MDVEAVIERVREVEQGGGDGDCDPSSQHLSASELENLPAHQAADCETVSDCAVCLVAVSSGQDVVRLPCAHTYHHPCIVRWLARSRRCPFCRASAVEPTAGRENADASRGGGGGGVAESGGGLLQKER